MNIDKLKLHLIMLVGGVVFGIGLSVSNMAQPEVVIDFLNFRDFGLLFVMFGAAAVTGIGFHVIPRIMKDSLITGDELGKRIKSLDRKVVIGGVIFGVGWGISGICPGAAYASLGIGNIPVLWALLGMFLGAYGHVFLRNSLADN
ncbi:MAG: putative membrane protein YedE/YeeE [Candidatus Nanohaloarchaea archaeon]|jgi:uncharacterized membrane protein YedE/YeeE